MARPSGIPMESATAWCRAWARMAAAIPSILSWLHHGDDEVIVPTHKSMSVSFITLSHNLSKTVWLNGFAGGLPHITNSGLAVGDVKAR